MTIDPAGVIQSALVAGLVGLVGAIWAATISLTRLATRLEKHEEYTKEHVARLDAEIRETAEVARAALYGEVK